MYFRISYGNTVACNTANNTASAAPPKNTPTTHRRIKGKVTTATYTKTKNKKYRRLISNAANVGSTPVKYKGTSTTLSAAKAPIAKNRGALNTLHRRRFVTIYTASTSATPISSSFHDLISRSCCGNAVLSHTESGAWNTTPPKITKRRPLYSFSSAPSWTFFTIPISVPLAS